MEFGQDTVVRLRLSAEMLSLLQAIADKQGLLKEEIAKQAVELWLEQFRAHGPAFSRRRVNGRRFHGQA